ncbi:diaminohydroxyphosphoribosylaminopyrimidine deaminase [Anseongella ginsenosidimutans]|uniref:Riboflavin biosynthesis protein RibD n=2 Tax=Anseongella ginsenosidimutans TaxID=496056 RepID=A0A4R3KS23_9SPHI|nr:diaminohydroxyphosphoribosylaminopyrimidine deaminase [Anseongella ginsenosidimutans]
MYMNRCLQLAANGLGQVSPNPIVGALILHNNQIIGEGWHRKYGEAHAEVNAIGQVLEKYPDAEKILKEAVMYVNLEPCAHQGKTPPCADLIIRHGIPEVVIGCPDPHEKVAGKGIEKLLAAGVRVRTGILEAACLELNRRFVTFQTERRPYVILKWAQTRNGYFAPLDGARYWITSPFSRQLVHRWRSEEDAVMVGYRTALADDPQLTVREWSGRNPLRIAIDRDLSLPSSLKLFDQTEKTLVFNAVKTDAVGAVHYLEVENFNFYFPQFSLYQLYLMDVQSLIIEGGAKTLDAFIKSNLWDEARIFTGAADLPEGIPAPHIYGSLVEEKQVGPDKLVIYRNKRKRPDAG